MRGYESATSVAVYALKGRFTFGNHSKVFKGFLGLFCFHSNKSYTGNNMYVNVKMYPLKIDGENPYLVTTIGLYTCTTTFDGTKHFEKQTHFKVRGLFIPQNFLCQILCSNCRLFFLRGHTITAPDFSATYKKTLPFAMIFAQHV